MSKHHNGWAFIYLTKGGSVTVDMTKFAAKNANAKWYNPKDGTYSSIGSYETLGQREFTSSTSGENNDWVLVLDNN